MRCPEPLKARGTYAAPNDSRYEADGGNTTNNCPEEPESAMFKRRQTVVPLRIPSLWQPWEDNLHASRQDWARGKKVIDQFVSFEAEQSDVSEQYAEEISQLMKAALLRPFGIGLGGEQKPGTDLLFFVAHSAVMLRKGFLWDVMEKQTRAQMLMRLADPSTGLCGVFGSQLRMPRRTPKVTFCGAVTTTAG